jgi:hypothetical protein
MVGEVLLFSLVYQIWNGKVLCMKKKKSLSLEDPTKDVTTQNLMSG